MKRREIDIDFRKYVFYDTLSPSGLTWKPRKIEDCLSYRACKIFNTSHANKMAGCKQSRPGYEYWTVRIENILFVASNVIYEIMIGKIPEGLFVDHINRDSLDNRIENLRLATKAENSANCKLPQNNKSGFKGVRESGNGWTAEIAGTNKQYLGTFYSIEEASEAYAKAARRLYGEFANP